MIRYSQCPCHSIIIIISADKVVYLSKKPRYQYRNCCIVSSEIFYKDPAVIHLALLITFFVVLVAAVVISVESIVVRFSVTYIVSCLIVVSVYYMLNENRAIVAKATIFLFLREVLQPNIDQVVSGTEPTIKTFYLSFFLLKHIFVKFCTYTYTYLYILFFNIMLLFICT